MTTKEIKALLREKEVCKKNLDDAERISQFYGKMKDLSFQEIKSFFPAPDDVIATNIFNYTNEILPNPSLDTAIGISLAMFKPENIEKCMEDTFQKDMQLLQALFFFLIKDILDDTKNKRMFQAALSDGSWRLPERQSQILNRISAGMGFNPHDTSPSLDFTTLGGKHFKANESVLRLFYNFMHPSLYAKEGIVNELNFIREQQKNILPIFPNTQKTNYKTSEANQEIRRKKENLEKLRQIDFGFFDQDYKQNFFACDEEFKESFSRPIECMCFQETKLEWDIEPFFKRRGRRKIVAKKSERAVNKSALSGKFLYSERNMITHVSENFAIFRLFSKEYGRHEIKYWEELVLESMYDAHRYILGMEAEDAGKKLLAILNHYFEKITDKLSMQEIPVEKRWDELFDEDGECSLDPDDLNKTNIYNILSEDEVTHFKRFMGFMYCSENDDSDFFERNRTRIQIYLIFISLRLSELDV